MIPQFHYCVRGLDRSDTAHPTALACIARAGAVPKTSKMSKTVRRHLGPMLRQSRFRVPDPDPHSPEEVFSTSCCQLLGLAGQL